MYYNYEYSFLLQISAFLDSLKHPKITFARNGPRGTYSHFCMSLADQSFIATIPKMCSSARSIGIGSPSGGGAPPTKNAISSSKSMRRQGPKVGGSVSTGSVCPFGRLIGVLYKIYSLINYLLSFC